MKRVATPIKEKKKEFRPTELELEKARHRIKIYRVIMDDEESKIFDEFQRKHWEDTVRYEQKHKKRK